MARRQNIKPVQTPQGHTVATEDLAPLLGVSPAEMHELMKHEDVAVFLEPRDGDDGERFQLTLDSPTMHARLTLDGEGTVISRSLIRFAKWLDSTWWELSLG